VIVTRPTNSQSNVYLEIRQTLLPHQVSPETLAAPSTEWKLRPSFEFILTTCSSYELDAAAERKGIEEAFASGVEFLKKSAASKRRERESKKKEEEWKAKETFYKYMLENAEKKKDKL
jgi:hypothetical protein